MFKKHIYNQTRTEGTSAVAKQLQHAYSGFYEQLMFKHTLHLSTYILAIVSIN